MIIRFAIVILILLTEIESMGFAVLNNTCQFDKDVIPQDSITVLFLHGSKPSKHRRAIEPTWFGGLHGGHVGILVDSNLVVDFGKVGRVHWIGRKKNRNSIYHLRSPSEFYGHFDKRDISMEKTEITIYIDDNQKRSLHHIIETYHASSPYDYAVLGMRCAAATGDLLQHAGILDYHSRLYLKLRYFMPKTLRNQLIKQAQEKQWHISRQRGDSNRIWEE